MKLSVIIPCYNEKKTIKKIIDKIFIQKINLEIILVDDGSDDGTVNIIKNYNCPMWILYDGSFDESGYEIDHIEEFSKTS